MSEKKSKLADKVGKYYIYWRDYKLMTQRAVEDYIWKFESEVTVKLENRPSA